jgi:N-acyl-D-amino-acid deacylase
MSIDVLIQGGRVADGTGGPLFTADVLVEHGSIVDVGHFDRVEAQHTIDASGQLVVPGFVDIHSHSDFTLLVDPTAKSALLQGVTTELVGNCGHGCAPITEPDLFLPNIYGYNPRLPVTWKTMAGYLDALEQAQPAINVASLVPNGNLRLATLGLEDRPATPVELARMEVLLEAALDEGAWGYSTGLEYAAERACSEAEMVVLAGVAARRGAMWATHTRNREVLAVESVEEAVRVARQAAVRLQVSHIVPRRGGPSDALARSVEVVDDALAEGMDIAFDAHTRLFGITNLNVALPAWALADGPRAIAERLQDPSTRGVLKHYQSLISSFGLGGWEHVFVLDAPRAGVGSHSIGELATDGRDAYDVIYDVLLAEVEQIHRPMCICWSYEEDQLASAFAHPLGMVGSDATTLSPDGPLAESVFHGAYTWAAWFFRRMVRERKEMSIEAAIHRLTGQPAERIGLRDRGRLARGMRADVAVLDADRFREVGTVERPNELASGVNTVLVNGRLAVTAGQTTGLRSGEVLRR